MGDGAPPEVVAPTNLLSDRLAVFGQGSLAMLRPLPLRDVQGVLMSTYRVLNQLRNAHQDYA